MTAVLRRYFRGRKLNTMEDVVAGKKYVYHFDHQGSTQALTDATTGAVTDRFASDAWGVPVKRTGTSLNRNWYIGNSGYSQAPPSALLLSPGAAFQPDVGAFLQALERAGYLLRDPVLTHGAVGQFYGPSAKQFILPPTGPPKPGPGPGILPPGPPSILPPGPPPGPGPWQGICARGYVWLRAGQSIVIKVAGCCKPMVFGVGSCIGLVMVCPTPTAPPEQDEMSCARHYPGCPIGCPVDRAISWVQAIQELKWLKPIYCKGSNSDLVWERDPPRPGKGLDRCLTGPCRGWHDEVSCTYPDGRPKTRLGSLQCCKYCKDLESGPRIEACCRWYRR